MLEEENYLTRPKIRVDTLVPRQFITIPAYTKVSTIKIEVPIGNIILIEKVQKVKGNGGTSRVASSSKLFHIKAVCDNSICVSSSLPSSALFTIGRRKEDDFSFSCNQNSFRYRCSIFFHSADWFVLLVLLCVQCVQQGDAMMRMIAVEFL